MKIKLRRPSEEFGTTEPLYRQKFTDRILNGENVKANVK